MNKFNRYWKMLLITSSLSLAGCVGTTYNQANQNIDQANTDLQDAEAPANQPAPAVIVDPGFYVDTRPVPMENYPSFLKQKVSLQAQQIPLSMLMDQALANSPMVVTFNHSVNTRKLVKIDYAGALKGALDEIAQQTGYSYTLDKNHLTWSAFETKIFNISFMPGASSYSVGGKLSAIQSSGGGGGGGASTSAIPEDNQFSSLTGNLSIWQDLQNTLNNLKSPKGEVVISQASTTVTVKDRPENIEAMSAYIHDLNKVLSQEVSLKVQVLDIQLTKDFDYGVDWSYVQHLLGSHFTVSSAAGSAADLSNGVPGSASSGGSPVMQIKLGGNNSNAVLNALSQEGKLSVVTQPTVVTLNNQVASIRITKDTGYLQSITTTLNNDSTTTAMTPGVVTDGFTLYLLPKIQNNHIYLQITSTLADLTSLASFSAGGGTSGSSSGASSSASTIQIPTVASKQFNIRSRVASGETLVIAGFKSIQNQTDKNSPFGIAAAGGVGARQENVQTVILITPTILESHSE